MGELKEGNLQLLELYSYSEERRLWPELKFRQ